jgi:hypothetical protein
VDLQTAFFCNHAQEDSEGKLDAHGIFHDLFAPGFPARHERMVLVLVIDWNRKDQGRYALKAELVAPDGSVVLTVDGHTDVDARAPHHPPARTRLVTHLEGVVFPKPGRYHLRLVVKGHRFRGPTLNLVPLDEGEGVSPPLGSRPASPGPTAPPGFTPTSDSGGGTEGNP